MMQQTGRGGEAEASFKPTGSTSDRQNHQVLAWRRYTELHLFDQERGRDWSDSVQMIW